MKLVFENVKNLTQNFYSKIWKLTLYIHARIQEGVGSDGIWICREGVVRGIFLVIL